MPSAFTEKSGKEHSLRILCQQITKDKIRCFYTTQTEHKCSSLLLFSYVLEIGLDGKGERQETTEEVVYVTCLSSHGMTYAYNLILLIAYNDVYIMRCSCLIL